MTARPGPDVATAPPAPAGHGWRAVSIVLVGAFMALLDTTIVNVALPSIRTGLHAPAQSLEMDRGRLRAGLRTGAAGARRRAAADRAWSQAAALPRPDHLHPGQRGLRRRAAPGRDRHRPGGAGARGRDLLPGHRRHHPAVLYRAGALPGLRGARRDDRRIDRHRPAARRPDHRGGRSPRWVALGVPGEPVHRGGHGAARGLAAALLPRLAPGADSIPSASPCSPRRCCCC